MPHCCCVPLCSVRSPGHKFPADSNLRKKWLLAIRRDKFVPSKYSRVCKEHFTPDDYIFPKETVRTDPKPHLKKNAVPSVFKWSVKVTESALARAERTVRRQGRFRVQPTDIQDETHHEDDGVCSSVAGDLTVDFWDPNASCDVTVEVESVAKEVGVQCSLLESNDISCPEINHEVKSETIDETLLKKTCDKPTLRLETLRGNPEMIQFYTGFEDYDHFVLVLHLFGEEVKNLRYYPNMQPAVYARVLSPGDELLMTVMKLRRNMCNTELAFLFGVSKSTVSNVFITWINYLHCQFKEMNIWAPHTLTAAHMKYRGKNCPCTIIIDCTEVKIDKPKNPVSQQLTYSNYKSANTLKVLIGISPSGAVTYISEAYGGAISDRELFERCGIIDLLQDGDVILCDRGFTIQDLVAHKNVTVNMPEFLKRNSGQFRPAQLRRSKQISSDRIHVERLIGLGKTYKMLCSRLTSSLVPLGGRIIFVCFMLINFRKNIVL